MKLEAFLRPKPVSAISQAQGGTDKGYATNGSSVPVESRKGSYTDSNAFTSRLSGKEKYDQEPKQTPIVVSSDGSNCDAARADSPTSEASGSDISESAYHKAWSSLSEDQRKQLTGEEDIRKLFDQLKQADQKHQDQCLLRKGLKVMTPYLERLRITIDFISPFASVEPAAGTALGIIKGVNSIAIAICGAADDITGHIESFFERVPAIERCNEVVTIHSRMAEIHNALVNVYKDLLQFYLKSITIFKKSEFAINVAMKLLKPEIPEIISSFNAHADVLSKLLDSETFASVQEIKNEQVETLIRDTLDINRVNEIAYHNELKRRADEACSWITFHEHFSYWKLNSRDSNLLALFGDMGCGKTITTAYVVDNLSQRHLVCAYYCKDDQETTKLGNIYRSLLWQLLKRKPNLKNRFLDWYRKTEQQSQVNPTQCDNKLRDFLYDALSSSKQWIFIALDGLDECDIYPQKQLLFLFHDLFKCNARLKVFISSRFDDDIESALPPGASRIEISLSKKRDRVIASYLAREVNIPKDIRDQAVDELSEKANGCAIWLRISLEYIRKSRIQSQKGLENALSRLPSSKGLAELYWTLFDKICSDLPENEDILQRALETLAVARRPLTANELAFAVFIDIEDDNRTTLRELEQSAHSMNLLDLIRPFISTISVENRDHLQLRLVHQSLKELILQAPPSSWNLVGKTRGQDQAVPRRAELDGSLLGRCIRYLLLDECKEINLSSSFRDGLDFDLLGIGRILDDDEFSTESPWSKSPQDFDPSDLGLGGFFTYAASYWTAHFSNTPQELWPDPTDLIDLCSTGSQRLKNWVEQWQRPNCSYNAELDFPEAMLRLDPLVVAAIFGPAAYMAGLLKCNLQTPAFLPNSIWIVLTRFINQNSASEIGNLLKNKDLRSLLCCVDFFYEVLLRWPGPNRLCGNAAKEWEDIFHFLVAELRDSLLDEGNEILCRAARSGCFLLVKKLFEASESDPDLRRAILVEKRINHGDWQIPNIAHQSIGEAAWEGHENIVSFLCQQAGIESHLRHINQRGRTVFHQAARMGHPQMFQCLIQHWPEGINLRNDSNDTPLSELISMNPVDTVKTARVILSMGKADATGLDDDPYYSPLCTAVRGGNIALCKILVVEGSADISYAVGIEETGKPFLTKDVKNEEKLDEQEYMLKELCSLIPLAVSTEYLFRM
ncbi:hypothetical protein MKX08_008751 [Trichoderma sp. CBMAI-0020]|nr:hypothetical protein MKX08_008751 [Trichoderma sp. CBMAI-0020]